MSNRLSKEQHIQIELLHRQGVNPTQISKRLSCARNTVIKHISDEKNRLLEFGPRELLNDIDGLDDEKLMKVLENNMRDGRAAESTAAVLAALRLRAEQSSGNPASEPMTQDEDIEFKRYLREDVYTDLCNECKDKAVNKQIIAASAETVN